MYCSIRHVHCTVNNVYTYSIWCVNCTVNGLYTVQYMVCTLYSIWCVYCTDIQGAHCTVNNVYKYSTTDYDCSRIITDDRLFDELSVAEWPGPGHSATDSTHRRGTHTLC